MRTLPSPLAKSRRDAAPGADLAARLEERIVGQAGAIRAIVPYVQVHLAGLAPEGRPVGVFLLLGPTGTGKTRTVEALAHVLHGSEKNVLRIDCGEYQLEHEVAKLIGAPPGYLGHRETTPMLNQAKLSAVTSENCNLSLVLFDEIEKAAGSLQRLLLGVLDKATLRLGDNTAVNFERSLIFLTSNLGAQNMKRILRPDFGFEALAAQTDPPAASKLEQAGFTATRRRFSPEFVNRIDQVITYQPLTRQTLSTILDLHLDELQRHIDRRLGDRAFELEVAKSARLLLLERGTSAEYGARELKRTLHRLLMQPLAAHVAEGRISPCARVRVEASPDLGSLAFKVS